MPTPSTIDLVKDVLFGTVSVPPAPAQIRKKGVNTIFANEELELIHSLKEVYLGSLRRGGKWTVDFEKVDGSTTSMICTLDPALLPPETEKLNEGNKKEKALYLISVYSLDRNGWRSFDVRRVHSFDRDLT